jgi:hypothetical protein
VDLIKTVMEAVREGAQKKYHERIIEETLVGKLCGNAENDKSSTEMHVSQIGKRNEKRITEMREQLSMVNIFP